MKIEYELLHTVRRGKIVNPAEIFIDLDGELELSFFMQGKKLDKLLLLLVDQNGQEHKLNCANSVKIPKRLIKPTTYQVFVFDFNGDQINKRWECEPLRLRRVDDIMQSKLEAEPDIKWLTDEMRAFFCKYELICKSINELKAEIDTLLLENNLKEHQISELERKLNEAIGAINILSEKIEQIEELEEK